MCEILKTNCSADFLGWTVESKNSCWKYSRKSYALRIRERG